MLKKILIAAVDRIVQFNILEFYRGQHTYVGIDTLGLSSVATGDVLRDLAPGFAGGHLKPFAINPASVFPLEDAGRAREEAGDREHGPEADRRGQPASRVRPATEGEDRPSHQQRGGADQRRRGVGPDHQRAETMAATPPPPLG